MGHTSGLACDWQTLRVTDPDDWLASCRALPLVTPPGKAVAYNNCAVMLIPAIVVAAAGLPFLDFVSSEVFHPLGITRFAWDTDRAGNPLAMSNLRLTATDLATGGAAAPPAWALGRHSSA